MLTDGRLMIEVEDDGIGMDAEPVGRGGSGSGIGMRNVRERMEVMYGPAAEVEMVSRPGRGTKVTLVLPVLQPGEAPWGPLGEALHERWVDVSRAMTRG